MALSMNDGDRSIQPVIICETCGKPIRNWETAVAEFDMVKGKPVSDVCIYHTGKCQPRVDYWMPLDKYFKYLFAMQKRRELAISKRKDW